jgi:hypothetical protein
MTPTRIVVSSQVRFVSNPEGAVLLHLERGHYQSLNGTGAAIWKEISGGASSDEVVTRLCDRYPAMPRERVETDVSTFLSQLAARGLVTLEAAP